MRPRTRASQRNNAQDGPPNLPPDQLSTIAVEASELQPPTANANKRANRKRAHNTANSDVETNPAKKKKASVTVAAGRSAPSHLRARSEAITKPIPDLRENLPERKARNNHPGTIDKPRAKRTTAEVQAEKVAQADAKRQSEELEEEKKRLYAQMEIDEDEKELERQVKAIRRLSDIVHGPVSESDSLTEEFDMDVDVSDSEGDNNDINSKSAGKSKQVSCTNKQLFSFVQLYLIPERNQGIARNACRYEGYGPTEGHCG